MASFDFESRSFFCGRTHGIFHIYVIYVPAADQHPLWSGPDRHHRPRLLAPERGVMLQWLDFQGMFDPNSPWVLANRRGISSGTGSLQPIQTGCPAHVLPNWIWPNNPLKHAAEGLMVVHLHRIELATTHLSCQCCLMLLVGLQKSNYWLFLGWCRWCWTW